MVETIMRSQVMREINTGRPFDLSFVLADRRRGTGGKLVNVRGWKRIAENLPEEQLPPQIKGKFIRRKNTRTGNTKLFVIFNPANRAVHPHTVHYWLMTSFNNKRIING
jgi:hypothetical protein